MKTAISLSDTLFRKAEQTANNMGIKRSQLFVLALEEFIAKHHGELVTKRLNEVYEKIGEKIDQDEFARDLDGGLESLRNFTKDDAW